MLVFILGAIAWAIQLYFCIYKLGVSAAITIIDGAKETPTNAEAIASGVGQIILAIVIWKAVDLAYAFLQVWFED